MFHHSVLIDFKSEPDEGQASTLRQYCTEIKQEVAGVIEMEFVANVSERSLGYSHAFIVVFSDIAAHDVYQNAKSHLALKAHIAPMAKRTLVLDYHQPSPE